MKIKGYIIVSTFLAALFLCATARKNPAAAQQPALDTTDRHFTVFDLIPDGDYAPETLVSFLYTEGIRNDAIGGDPALTVSLFEKVLELDSLHAPTYYELAALYSGEPEKGLGFIRKAVELDPENVWYISGLAQTLIEARRYDEALAVFRELEKASPENPMNTQMIAALYAEKGDIGMAVAVLDSAEMRFGMTEEISSFKRQLFIEAKQYDKAIEETEKMIENFVFDNGNYIILAELYSATGQDSLAQAAYDRLSAMDPDDIDAIVSMNEYYKQRGDNYNFLATARRIMLSDQVPMEAKIDFFNEITLNDRFYAGNLLQIGNMAKAMYDKYPDDPQVLLLYARHLTRTGNGEEGISIYKARIADPVGEADMETFLTVLDYEGYYSQRPDSVYKYADMALRRFPDNPELYMRKGFARVYLEKNYKKAEGEFKKALKYTDKDADSTLALIYGFLGDNSHMMDKKKQSYKYYDKALKYDPDNILVNNNYSYYLSLAGEHLDKALAMAEKVVTKLAPGNPTYLDTYAWALYKMERYEEARTVMRQAVSLDSTENPELFIHYGDILHALEDNFMAEVYWKKALESGYDSAEIEKRLKSIGK